MVQTGHVELVQDIISVMAAYCDLWGVCTVHGTHASEVTICSHNIDNVLYPLWTKCVILAKYWMWLPDDGSFVNRNTFEQFSLF